MTVLQEQYEGVHAVSSVIFDVDGVLVDTVPLHFHAWQKAFLEAHIPFGAHEYEQINGIPRDEGIRIILGADATSEHVKEIGDRKQHYYLESLTQVPPKPLPGILSLLIEIRRLRWKVAAASSSKNAVVVLATAQLIGYFDAIVTGHDFTHPKPHPDIFLRAAGLLKVKPAVAAVVEDAASGVRAARAGGFRCVAVASSESAENLYAAGASVVVATTLELSIDLLRRL